MKRLLGASAVLLLAGGVLGAAPVAATAADTGTTYYVDAANGNDSAAGSTTATAWRTLAKVDATKFGPGDRILLHAGQKWTGQLWPKGSGTDGLPITIDAYGSGAKPQIDGAGQVADAVRLHNQQYWDIKNLQVTNVRPLAGGQPGTNLRDLRGIGISGDTGGQLNHLHVDGVDVRDVTGEDNWISGDTANNKPGITFKTGWDRSKNTGGIVFRGLAANPASPGRPTILHDVLVANSTIRNTSFGGITVKQYTGSNAGAVHTGWGERTSATDTAFAPHTQVVIRDNYIYQGDSAYAANGVYITDTRGGVVERNVIQRAGTSGIEANYADDVTIQHNEVYGTEKKAGGADSNGIDADNATTKIVVQGNFVHDNGDGILLCQCGRNFGDVRVRYNVISGNSRYQIYLHSNRGTTAYVYNNTIHNSRSNYLIYGYGANLSASYHLWNNVLYSTRAGASLTTSPTIEYTANLYGGATLPVPSSDRRAVRGDPRFLGTITGPYGNATSGPALNAALPLRVAAGSPAVDAGISVSDNGGVDYSGAAVYNRLPDIGAFEYRAGAARALGRLNERSGE
ncbi:right-handed parallel beta-helix repeat-containing protein [Streptomyces griseiscabiei]|uniref:Right-handed parallel beta-helix repeat-containing protein n=1 Tax=Streptomyces griseiscabiei TaxID=2993540 RepID=A0ABU4LGN8_9ACTN|nr:right-handed parallel beta-helix repeat-containing protein [Streptomyces griseiscabiei]MDX2914611.1 right-handed parallel beta-helix repeat-containing protein [Streptomyces griseiscabiei]